MAPTAASRLLFLVCSVLVVHHSSSAGCSVNVNSGEMPSHQPLLLKEDAAAEKDMRSFLAPDASGHIRLDAGAQVLVACPDSKFKLGRLDGQILHATCVSGTVFTVTDIAYTLNTLACTQLPKASAKRSEGNCSTDPNKIMVEIGFTVEDEFYKLYEVCFNHVTLASLYTNATVIAGIKGFQESFPKPKWETGGLYGSVDMTNQYKTLRDTLVNLLGTVPPNMGNNYLNKGHLAAKADFALGVQQSATFYYANSAPQWYAFNAGNWNQLELDVRAFASANNFDLQVYTGTYGTLKLANKDKVQTEIYLYVSTNETKVPVPMLFWKLIYEPKSKLAMAFIGVNNPYYSSDQLPSEYKLCPDVCNNVNWLRWKPTNQTSGLTYCCEYAEFKAKVDYVPFLDVQGTFLSAGREATSALKLLTIFCSVWLLIRQS